MRLERMNVAVARTKIRLAVGWVVAALERLRPGSAGRHRLDLDEAAR